MPKRTTESVAGMKDPPNGVTHNDELVGLTEIAQRAGVQKPAVSMWRTRHSDFPDPAADLATGPVWRWEPVRRWLEATGRETDAGWSRADVNKTATNKPLPRKERDDRQA